MNDADREKLTEISGKLFELQRQLKAASRAHRAAVKVMQELNDEYFDLFVKTMGMKPEEFEASREAAKITAGQFKEGNQHGRVTKAETEGKTGEVSDQRPATRVRTPTGRYAVRHGLPHMRPTGRSNPDVQR
jgi:hypothetical protein